MQLSYCSLKKKIKNKRIFVLTGKKSSQVFKNILEFKHTKDTFIYKKKNLLPKYNELIEIIKKIKNSKPDFVIGIGGGSVIDYTKLACVLINKRKINFIIKNNYQNDIKKLYKSIIIPTTAGSGSEVTKFSVIYIKNKKYSYQHSAIKPNYYFYLPNLLTSLSRENRSYAAFDAFAQSMESLFSKEGNQISDYFAKKSIKIITLNLKKYLSSNNLKVIKKMQEAATLSGKAISIAKTNGPHALSYYFSLNLNMPHGHAVAMSFVSFFKFNIKNHNRCSNVRFTKNIKWIFKFFGCKNLDEFEFKMEKILKSFRIETSYKKNNISINQHYPSIIKDVNLQRLRNNPIQINKTDLKKIILRQF